MKERWNPEYDERVWFVTIDDVDNEVRPTRWYNYSARCKRLYESGNCFKTKEQAEAALEKIKKVLLEAHNED